MGPGYVGLGNVRDSAMTVQHVPTQMRISTRNQWFQRVQAVKNNRRKRWKHRLFVVEGVRGVNQLRTHPKWRVEALLHAHGTRLSDWARGVLADVPAAYHLALDAALLEELSDKDDTSELMAVVHLPNIDDQPLPHEMADLALVLDRPGNPGNLGTITRSADALGGRAVVITGHAADPFDPAVIRATAGSFFGMEVRRMTTRAALTDWLDAARAVLPGLQVAGTSAQGDTPPWACDFTRPTVLVMGNETVGLSEWLREQCDTLLRIDMAGGASSLNLACATTAFLYEAHAQRCRALPNE